MKKAARKSETAFCLFKNGNHIFTNASFGALHTGHAQLSGRSSNFVPSFASSYTYPHTVHRHIIASLLNSKIRCVIHDP